MRGVLFVDDEAEILAGLQVALRRLSKRLRLRFAQSGQEALALMEREPIDVIVSDMRMPGMDGPTLLGHVRQRYPSVVRFVLSGHAEPAATIRAMAICHQYLSKPCEPALLGELLDRSCKARDEFETLLGGTDLTIIDRVPCDPAVYGELVETVDRPAATINEIVSVIERDPAMALALLRAANSGLFGRDKSHVSLPLAIGLMERVTIKAVVEASCATQRSTPAGEEDVIRRHCVEVAKQARQMQKGTGNEDAAYCVGLLHDVGALALGREAPMHAELGAYMLAISGLPDAVVDAVAHHHAPQLTKRPDTTLLDAVCEAHERVLAREGKAP